MVKRPLSVRIGMLYFTLLLGTGIFAFGAGKTVSKNSFYFVQLSDTHWGFSDTNVNPDYTGTLKKAISEVNNLKVQPDFIIFTGDLTHTTGDPKVRRQRMAEFKTIVSGLKATNIYFIPGEHDASLDNGEAYKEYFGKTYYTFEHKGVHFIAMDNVSDPTGKIGDAQIQWLSEVLKKFDKNSQIVVFTHRPLFDLYPKWDWWTADGAQALDLLKPYKYVNVYYGHIHQDYEKAVGQIKLHALKGLMYPLPAPGSQPKKAPIPWDPAQPYKGLGFRVVEVNFTKAENGISEYPITVAEVNQPENVIQITAKKFKFSPDVIRLKKGVPVVLELRTLDILHGFSISDMNISAKIEPGKVTRVRIVPEKTGKFGFECNIFCGEGHDDMTGTIIVE